MMSGARSERHVILVDGTCIFCNRLVAHILRRDRAGIFAFAHLQGPFARDVFRRHGREPGDVDGVYLVLAEGTPGERLLVDGDAGREIWPRLYSAARILRWIPIVLLNVGYRAFAKVRYRLFGQSASCIVPTAAERARFVE